MRSALESEPPNFRHHVAFRVDASGTIGFGHVMRCLALADALSQRASACTFLLRTFSDSLPALIRKRGHTPINLSLHELDAAAPPTERWFDDALATFSNLEGLDIDWIVLDHYGLGVEWERNAQERIAPVLAIDDLPNRPHNSEILLDQTYGRRVDDYRSFVKPQTDLLLGTNYALLAPQFAAVRPDTLAERQARGGSIERMLISFGATDPGNLTQLALEAVKESRFAGQVDIVLGHQAPYLEDIRACVSGLANASLHVGVGHMADLIRRADLGIGAGGTTSWERCSLGLPAIVLEAADNQRDIIRGLMHAGAALHIPTAGATELEKLEKRQEVIDVLAETINTLMRDPSRVAQMSANAAELCDGLGAQRVASRLLREVESQS